MMTFILAATLVAQTPPPQQAPPTNKPAEAKTEAKVAPLTAAGMAGKWTVTVTTSQGPVDSSIDIKADPKDAKKFSGTITSQLGTANLTGEVVDGKLSFSFPFNSNGNETMLTFNGEQQKDGSLAGTLDFGAGAINWTAVKAK
jgi:hypothetical protein